MYVEIPADTAQLQKIRAWMTGCLLLGVILYSEQSFWGKCLVCCPEFRGGRFSEVANVLYSITSQSGHAPCSGQSSS